jgi:hypothetical protein
MSEFPVFEASLLRAAHRRYGWRRWRPRIVVALVVAAAAGVMLLVVARPGPREPERQAVSQWTHYSVPRYGLDVSLPKGWHLAPRTLTPHLLDPHEIMSATTFGAGAPLEGCAQLPAAALRRMGATDALVSVQERGKGSPANAPRPLHFAHATFVPVSEIVVSPCAGPGFAGSFKMADFSDGPRNLTALVALGNDASPAVRGQAYAILDRLRLDPGFAPWWRFSG